MAARRDSAVRKVLVVHADPAIGDRVRAALSQRPYRVQVTQSAEDALIRAQQDPPDLIISDLQSPPSGWNLVQRLRSLPEFGSVPIFALIEPDTSPARMHALRLGADDCLPREFAPEELEHRVVRSMERVEAARAAIGGAKREGPVQKEVPGLQGNLAQIALASVLQMIELEKKSGVLSITSLGDVETARIFFRGGTIVSARLEGKEEPKNEEVIYSVLGWKEGRFHLKALAVDGDDEIHQSTAALLVEGARRLDELRRGGAPPAR